MATAGLVLFVLEYEIELTPVSMFAHTAFPLIPLFFRDVAQSVASEDSEERSGVNQREPFFSKPRGNNDVGLLRCFNLAHFESGLR